MMAVINIKMADVEFVGQTKDQLGSAAARSAVDAVVAEKMSVYLEENPQVAQMLVKKAIQAAKAREAARKVRDEIRSGKKRGDGPSLGGKLAPAQSKDYIRNELFIVEGDSAGGSAKQGRDSRFQAILPLKGKPMNPEKAKLADVLKNDEYQAIIAAIGAGIGSEFDVDACNYGKIIIMTDADSDGAHIQVLLLTFFYRYMKPLIESGRVFIAQPPLYKITKKSGKQETVRYAWTEEQLRGAPEGNGKKRGAAALQRTGGNEPRAAVGNDDEPGHADALAGADRGRGQGRAPGVHADGRQGGPAQAMDSRPRRFHRIRRMNRCPENGRYSA